MFMCLLLLNMTEDKKHQLCRKWLKRGDSEEKRLLSPFLKKQLHPMSHAILVDDIDYFESNYLQHYDTSELEAVFARACLCGSRNIGTMLLDKLQLSYCDNEYILSYVCSSNNIEWVTEIANVWAKNGKTSLPENIYRLSASFKIIDIVRKILSEPQRQIFIKTLEMLQGM